ncbi:DUF5914 domain-containing protein [Mycobacterium sp.]|uniref:DUF5914 domain-containing protein n=1 Tax=Mycobacterium sp. TaxID=1785 RepID=UPI002CE4A8CE|nr:DUF5914 domain-containing protein [Mycobacterium sp.]HME46879.1 DUF5914 domain-containing protein [Mycobacterium sp.]
MGMLDRLGRRWPKNTPLQVLPRMQWAGQRPTYRDAEPAIIDAALRRSRHRPSGNWYAFAASTSVRAGRPFGTSVAGVEIVAWRGETGALHVGPGTCPHLGADLATGTVDCGALICPWHGLRLTGERGFGWKPLPGHDDGVLVWVRLDRAGGEDPSGEPFIPVRPSGSRLHAVTRLVGTCEPGDIIANRLDPWHGAWFHPYSFTQLDVLSAPPRDATDDADRFLVAVTFRMGRFGVPVVAEFTSPERRTIVMRIVDGEGAGSVVETHATPVGTAPDGRPRTAVLEAVIAHSDRSGFAHTTRVAPLITPLMRYAATKLWRDDLAYAERRYHLRAARG